MLVVRGLEKFFNQKPLFHPIDFTAQEGFIYLVKGPNGSGKTTLLKCLSGHLNFEKGEIQLQGHQNETLKKISGLYLTQENSFFPQLSLKENIHFYTQYFSYSKDLTPLIEGLHLSQWWNKKFQECSSGIKRRLGILRSLLNQPKILLLDEPLSFMDDDFSKSLSQFLTQQTQSQKMLTFISSHSELNTLMPIKNTIEVKPC